MRPNYVLDTHALLWLLTADRRLSERAREAMSDGSARLLLPLIALAEACWLVEHGRSPLLTVPGLLADVDRDPRLTVVPVTRETLQRSLPLTAIREMHDRLIVATALTLSDTGTPAVLVTRDQDITGSGLVPVLW